MGLLSVQFQGNLKRQWSKKKYQRLNGSRKNLKVVRLGSGGNTEKRGLKLRRAVPKLRLKFLSPLKLWTKFKNAYMDMMLKLASKPQPALNGGGNSFGGKRIPKARKAPLPYRNQEFENRLILEIYKSLVTSMELIPAANDRVNNNLLSFVQAEKCSNFSRSCAKSA